MKDESEAPSTTLLDLPDPFTDRAVSGERVVRAGALGDVETDIRTSAVPRLRWCLARAGIVNVYQYDKEEIEFRGGRLLLRGVNGAGKSTAMNMLLPFLLTASERNITAASGHSKVLKAWMLDTRDAAQIQPVGYLWIEFARADEVLTLGCGIRANRNASYVDTWWFVTPHRLAASDANAAPGTVPVTVGDTALTRDQLRQALPGSDSRVFTDKQRGDYRSEVRRRLFGGADISEHIELLNKLRDPRIGDAIDNKLAEFLARAMPSLSEQAVSAAPSHYRSWRITGAISPSLNGHVTLLTPCWSDTAPTAGAICANAATQQRQLIEAGSTRRVTMTPPGLTETRPRNASRPPRRTLARRSTRSMRASRRSRRSKTPPPTAVRRPSTTCERRWPLTRIVSATSKARCETARSVSMRRSSLSAKAKTARRKQRDAAASAGRDRRGRRHARSQDRRHLHGTGLIGCRGRQRAVLCQSQQRQHRILGEPGNHRGEVPLERPRSPHPLPGDARSAAAPPQRSHPSRGQRTLGHTSRGRRCRRRPRRIGSPAARVGS